jgi:hypothetical protein
MQVAAGATLVTQVEDWACEVLVLYSFSAVSEARWLSRASESRLLGALSIQRLEGSRSCSRRVRRIMGFELGPVIRGVDGGATEMAVWESESVCCGWS